MIACCRRLTRKGRTDGRRCDERNEERFCRQSVRYWLSRKWAVCLSRPLLPCDLQGGPQIDIFCSLHTVEGFYGKSPDVMICRMLSFNLRHGSNLWRNRSFRHPSPFPIRTLAICSFLPRPEKFLPRRQTMQTIPSFFSLLCIVSKFSVSSDGGVSHLRIL